MATTLFFPPFSPSWVFEFFALWQQKEWYLKYSVVFLQNNARFFCKAFICIKKRPKFWVLRIEEKKEKIKINEYMHCKISC
jgi:hypothetical protein